MRPISQVIGSAWGRTLEPEPLERSRPVLDLLRPQIEAAQAQALPASARGKAARYTLALWPKLVRFLDHRKLN